MPRVSIPSVGLVDFPDEMSSDDINAAAGKLYAQASQGPAQESEPKAVNQGAPDRARSPNASTTTVAPASPLPLPVQQTPLAPQGGWERANALSAALYDPEEEEQQNAKKMEASIAGVTRPIVGAVEAVPKVAAQAALQIPNALGSTVGIQPLRSDQPIIPRPAEPPTSVVGGVATGLWDVASTLSTPESLGLILAFHEFPPALQNVAAGYFSGQMAKGTAESALEATKMYMAGNYPAAARSGAASLASGVMTAAPFTDAAKGWNPEKPLEAKAPTTPPQPVDFDPYALKAGQEVTPEGIVDHDARSAQVVARIPARQPFAPPVAPVSPETVQRMSTAIGEDFASQRAAMGEPVPLSGRSQETSAMPGGDDVTKLNPPDKIFRDALTDVLMNPASPEEWQTAGDRLRVLYDIKTPITVTLGDEPLARTEFGKDGAASIFLSQTASPYELAHEVAEIASKAGDENAIRVHDNNVIMDDATKRVAAPSITKIVPADKPSDLAAEQAAHEILTSASAMGAAAFSDYGKNFYDNTLVPAGQKVAQLAGSLKDAALNLADVFSSTRGVARGTLDAARAAVGRSYQVKDAILQSAIETGAKMTEAGWTHADRVAVIDAIGRGELPDWAQGIAPLVAQYRKMSDAQFAEMQQYKPDLGYLQNRLGYMWETPPLWPEGHPVREAAKEASLTGNVNWQMARQMQSVFQGEALGGKLRTDSVVQMMVNDLRNQGKFSTGNGMWEQMKSNGDAVQVPRDGSVLPPEGYKRFDLKGDLARGWITDAEGEKTPSDWYIDNRADLLLRNYLSVSPYSSSAFVSAIAEASMLNKAALLAIPAYHWTTMAQVAAGSQFIKALGELPGDLATDPIPGLGKFLKLAATSPAAFADRIMLGNRVRSYFADPGEFLKSAGGEALLERYPELTDDLGMFYQVGGRLGIDESYRVGLAEAVRNALANRDPAGAAVRAIAYAAPEALHATGAALFENIPKMKVGTWLEELQDLKRTRASDYASGRRDLVHDAGDLWNSIENRAGMVGYDLQFLNRTVKTGLQLATLSYGWTGGTIRMAYNAATSQIGEVLDSIGNDGSDRPPVFGFNRAPRVTPEMRALVSAILPYVAATTAIQIMRTGIAPWNSPTPLKDVVEPRDGTQDQDGLPGRWKIPGYGGPLYDLATNPWTTMTHKMSPLLRGTIEAAQNERFFDRSRVYNPNDPGYKEVLDGLRWALAGSIPGVGGTGAGPIYYQNWTKELERLSSGLDTSADVAMTAAGASRASNEIDKTPFMKALDYSSREKLGSTTVEKASAASDTAMARKIISQGGDPSEVLARLAPTHIKSAEKVGMSRYEGLLKGATLDEGVDALERASPAELMRYMPILNQKFVYPNGGIKNPFQGYTPSQTQVLQDKLTALRAKFQVLQAKGATIQQETQ
jgi:hypothetical protein